MKKIAFWLFVLVFLNSFSQEKATLSGYVTSNGTTVKNADVFLNETKIGTKTNSEGFYEFSNLALKKYTVEVSGIAFKKTEKK